MNHETSGVILKRDTYGGGTLSLFLICLTLIIGIRHYQHITEHLNLFIGHSAKVLIKICRDPLKEYKKNR